MSALLQMPDPLSLPRALQALFEAWTNDTWSDPISTGDIAATAVMFPIWPSCPVRLTFISSEPEAAPAIYHADDDDDDQDSAFAIAFAEIEEARRACDGLAPGSVSDELLWAVFYRD